MNTVYFPRICAALVLGGFFLPWVNVDFLGLKKTISGIEWATTQSANGSHNYGVLIAPILAIVAAVIHTKRNYVFLSIASALVLLLVGPIQLKEGATELGVSRGIGLWVSLIGLAGMIVAADFLTAGPTLKEKSKMMRRRKKPKSDS